MSGHSSEVWDAVWIDAALAFEEADEQPGSQRWIGALAMLVSGSVSVSTLWWLGRTLMRLFAG